jgi:exodeoxyribonuclease VII large subunit
LENTYSLSDLNEFVRRVIALNFTESLWVSCEVAQAKCARGHWYLDLVEKEESILKGGKTEIVAQISAMIWATDYNTIKRKSGEHLEGLLQQGTQIRVKARMDFHERYGIKLIIEDIDLNFTIGQMELQRQETLKELSRLKLLDKNAQIPQPLVYQRIAVISSSTAAGWIDFEHHLSNNPYGYTYQIILFPAAMQGVNTELEVFRQLAQINAFHQDYDCIAILRGGGSRLDLQAFDSLDLAKAIAKSKLPVLVGIGHEIDRSVLDEVAAVSLKTPTAVADFLIANNARFESEIINIGNEIKQRASSQIETQSRTLDNISQILKYKSQTYIQQSSNQLKQFEQIIRIQSPNLINTNKNRLDALEQMTKLLSIESALERGFSITRLAGRAISSVNEIEAGDTIQTQLKDGIVETTRR